MGFVFRARRGSLKVRLVLTLIVLGVLGYQRGYFARFLGGGAPAAVQGEAEVSTPVDSSPDGAAEVDRLFNGQRSGQVVEVRGLVRRTLEDDREGSPHQRFVLELSNGRTLLIAHNLALAERVPLQVGDDVRARGEYEWNEQGGVLHWTHHDPDGQRPGGWIEHRGTRYR